MSDIDSITAAPEAKVERRAVYRSAAVDLGAGMVLYLYGDGGLCVSVPGMSIVISKEQGLKIKEAMKRGGA